VDILDTGEEPQPAALKRSIGLTALIFYGLGTMVGGGFYALLGRVAGLAGPLLPVALAFSGMLALLSAASFAELSSRFPVSAGEVRYVEAGFNVRALATTIGWLVILTGVVSAATLAVATIGFLQDLLPVPEGTAILVLVLGMGLVAGWGITESVGIVFAITVIEVGALVYVGVVAGGGELGLGARWLETLPSVDAAQWTGVFSGAFLAFYAFIGFEDMVNIAEEVKRPRRTLPIAILTSVVATTVLYVWIGLVAVLSVPPADLAGSNTPIAEIVRDHGVSSTGIGVVSLLTGVNGALVQIVMAARVAYGMAARGQAPAVLGRVQSTTRTPLVATALMTGVIAVLALFFPMTTLARATSSIMLVNFTVVHLSLWRIKRTDPDPMGEGPRLPSWLPLCGACSCAGALLVQVWTVVS
jgi:amino acid transporter